MKKETDFNEIANIITEIVNEVIVNYESNFEQVGKFDKELQDILHSIELEDLPCKERYKLSTKLKTNRLERRKHKDIVENYSSIYNFLNSYNNKKTVLQFANELKRHIYLKSKMGQRTYVKRVK